MNRDAALRERAAGIVADGLPIGPRAYPCSCGAERGHHGGKGFTGKCEPTGCVRFRLRSDYELAYRAIDAAEHTFADSMKAFEDRERAAKRKANPKLPGQISLGPSDTGRCRAQIMFRERPPEDFYRSVEDKSAARMGGIIHEEAVRRLAILYPWRMHEQDVVIPGLDRPGRFDQYDPITGVVDDLKTAGTWKYDHVVANGPDDEMYDQTLMYALGLARQGYRVTGIRIIVVGRDKGRDVIYPMAYDEDRALRAIEALLDVATALDLGQTLPRDRSGPSTDALCRLCFARDYCWNIPQATALGRSGESYTVLGEEYNVDDVENAALNVKAAADAKNAAKRVEDENKALLAGIPAGVYGIAQGKYRNGNTVDDHQARIRQIEAWIKSDPETRPPYESLVYPKTQYAGWMAWGPLPKKELAAALAERTAQAEREAAAVAAFAAEPEAGAA